MAQTFRIFENGTQKFARFSTNPRLYKDVGDRQQRRRSKFLREILQNIGMTPQEAVVYLMGFCGRNGHILPDEIACGPLVSNDDARYAATFALHQQFTDAEVKFLRKYFRCIPSMDRIRAEKWRFLESMPPLLYLSEGATIWEVWVPVGLPWMQLMEGALYLFGFKCMPRFLPTWEDSTK